MPRRNDGPSFAPYEVDELFDDIAWDLFEFNYEDLAIEEKATVLTVVGTVVDAQEFGYGHTYGDLDRYERVELLMRSLPTSQESHTL